MHSATKQKAVWLLQAHDTGLSTFDISPTHPGLIVTGSTDKQVKLWHVAPSSRGPSLVLSRDLDLGKIFSTQFGPDKDVAMRVAVAGSAGSIKVWDLSTSNAARKAFGVSGRVKEAVEEGKVVGVNEDKDDEEDDEEDGDGGDEGWENMDDN
jgi:periodic tryptophan protein 1